MSGVVLRFPWEWWLPIGAGRAVLRHAWRRALLDRGMRLKECPVPGLFAKSGAEADESGEE